MAQGDIVSEVVVNFIYWFKTDFIDRDPWRVDVKQELQIEYQQIELASGRDGQECELAGM